jgi:hypothetical protein
VKQPPLVFTDTETVSLDPYGDVIWEIAAILEDPDKQAVSEWVWQVRPDERKMSDFSRPYYEAGFKLPDDCEAMLWTTGRVGNMGEPGLPMTRSSVAEMFVGLTDGRHVVGAVPDFDTWRMRFFVEKWAPKTRLSWHYHLRDVENLAVGWLLGVEKGRALERRAQLTLDHPKSDQGVRVGGPDWIQPDGSWESDDLYRALGADPSKYARHSALGDCRLNRDVYHRIMG